jgi:hypothetical protein
MQFNRYIWELYASSKSGKSTIKRFMNFEKCKTDSSYLEAFFGVGEKLELYEPDDESLKIIQAVYDFASQFEICTLEDAIAVYEKLVSEKLSIKFDANEDYVLDAANIAFDIQLVSIGLHLAHPEYFLPYGFVTVFDRLLEIANNFPLSIPPVPKKGDFEGKALYYNSINQSFQEFRRTYELSPSEMCAFLYDFALMFTNDPELPEPSKAWLVVGSKHSNDDFEFLESADISSQSHWQGNLETRLGDIIVMYVASPYSRIHSIWRAETNGFVDPFFDFHSTIWITNPIKTVPISFKEMKSHSLLSQNGYIRAHLQGVTGKPLKVEEYEAILEMMAVKGQDISLLPRIPRTSFIPNDELANERDVETKLVEPLLEKLGYTSKDWVRQMPVRMGRGERKYPDYAFHAKQKRGEESAAMVLETKYSISRDKDLQEAYFQMRSYALRLQSQRAVLAAREGIWIFTAQKGNFSLEKHFKFDWLELSNPNVLHKVRQLIGK